MSGRVRPGRLGLDLTGLPDESQLLAAHVLERKKWFSWSDSYSIDIADGEDDVLMLCAAVVIDQVSHEGS